MNNIELLKEILTLVGPVLASIAATVSGIAVVVRMLKKDRDKTVSERMEDNKRMVEAMEKQQKSMAVMQAKITSMEKHVAEMENRIK
jgi:TolA-binding protein